MPEPAAPPAPPPAPEPEPAPALPPTAQPAVQPPPAAPAGRASLPPPLAALQPLGPAGERLKQRCLQALARHGRTLHVLRPGAEPPPAGSAVALGPCELVAGWTSLEGTVVRLGEVLLVVRADAAATEGQDGAALPEGVRAALAREPVGFIGRLSPAAGAVRLAADGRPVPGSSRALPVLAAQAAWWAGGTWYQAPAGEPAPAPAAGSGQ
ncbi:MAG: hypothetical protein KatS3mg102_1516 [Planctomycetota bacterium]|nr:MAG: hypothetical protein KatS3mg102_1516 [Planctomycetota bacterium]